MRAAAAALVSTCALMAIFGALAGPARADDDASRAVASYVAMERYLFDWPARDYRDAPGGGPGADAWPLSQAVAATLAVARIPSVTTDAGAFVARGFAEIATMRSVAGPLYESAPGGGDVYYDDNEWIAQDLLDRGDTASLRDATAIFTAIVHAWDGDATHPCAGGVFWTTAAGVADRNTVSTANGALVGLRLYALTRRPVFLYWSRRMLDWVNACMLAPDGLYWDHVDAAGTIDRNEWSYNQGTLVGAYLDLYETTRDASALARAEQIADATLAGFSNRWLTAEPPEFAAIFFRHLLELAAVDRRQAYVDAASAYGAAAWERLRDPQTGLFSFPGSAPLLVQASFVQLYAALASTAGRPHP